MPDHLYHGFDNHNHRELNANESDSDSDSTLCSDLERQNMTRGIPTRGRGRRVSYIADPFGVDDEEEFPPGLFGMGGLFGLDGGHTVVYEGYNNHDFDEPSDFDDEDEYDEEISDYSPPEYDDFNMQLGKLKLVPSKNHKYKIVPYFDPVFSFDAAEQHSILQAFGPPKHENLVPFKLDNASSFAEWYFYFKHSYARTSPLNQAYCTVDKRTFSSFFKHQGELSSFENNFVIDTVEQAFSDTFKKCLGKNLQKTYANRNLSREIVELLVVRELEKKAKKGIMKNRHAILYDRATTGDYIPYVRFLQAHEFPEDDIYDLVSTAFVRNINDNKDLRYYDKMREKFRHWPGTPSDRLCNLVDFLREEDLVKSMEVPSYDVKTILKENPEYENFHKKGKSRNKKKKKKSTKDICLRFHPEFSTVEVPIHSNKDCQSPTSRFWC